MRYSSREWETDPRFVQQLLRFNQLDHINFNPILDTNALRKTYKRILNVDVPMVFKQYSKNRANVVNYHRIDQNYEDDFPNGKKGGGSHEVDPDVIFDRFVKDYQNENETVDIVKQKDLEDKMQGFISHFEHKILNKTIFTSLKKEGQGQSNKEKALAEIAAQEEAERQAQEEDEPSESESELYEEPTVIVVDGEQAVMPVQNQNKPKTRFQLLMDQYKERKRKEKEEMGKLKADMDEEPERRPKKEEPTLTMKLLGLGGEKKKKTKSNVRLSWQLQP